MNRTLLRIFAVVGMVLTAGIILFGIFGGSAGVATDMRANLGSASAMFTCWDMAHVSGATRNIFILLVVLSAVGLVLLALREPERDWQKDIKYIFSLLVVPLLLCLVVGYYSYQAAEAAHAGEVAAQTNAAEARAADEKNGEKQWRADVRRLIDEAKTEARNAALDESEQGALAKRIATALEGVLDRRLPSERPGDK